MRNISASYWAGARAVAPLAPVIGIVGVLFGYLATTAGLTPAAAIVMSATTFAGSAQFAAIAVLGAGGTIGAAVTAAALLNARYAILGISAAPAISGSPLKRLLVAQFVVDETWAIAYAGDGRFDIARLIGAGSVLFVVHVVSTAAGALGGNSIADPTKFGLDAAFPALFVVLLRPHLTGPAALVAAAAGATIALSLAPFVPAGIPIVAAAAASLIGLRSR
jgi:predicted branched-subunit amino acid permease